MTIIISGRVVWSMCLHLIYMLIKIDRYVIIKQIGFYYFILFFFFASFPFGIYRSVWFCFAFTPGRRKRGEWTLKQNKYYQNKQTISARPDIGPTVVLRMMNHQTRSDESPNYNPDTIIFFATALLLSRRRCRRCRRRRDGNKCIFIALHCKSVFCRSIGLQFIPYMSRFSFHILFIFAINTGFLRSY